MYLVLCDCYQAYCQHNPAKNNLKIRDIVVAKEKGHPLRCGSGIYPQAIVLSVNPLVLVSDQGDMRWSCYYAPLQPVGKTNWFKYLYLKLRRGSK